MKPHLPPQPPLSETDRKMQARLGQFAESTRKALEVGAEMVQLRKWCVEQAVATYAGVGGGAVIPLAKEIYQFVSEPLTVAVDHIKERAGN